MASHRYRCRICNVEHASIRSPNKSAPGTFDVLRRPATLPRVVSQHDPEGHMLIMPFAVDTLAARIREAVAG